MKRNRAMMVALVFGMLLTTSAGANVATPRVDRREARQEHRIANGIRSGQLTRREAFRLERGEARINRMQWRSEADGRVTPRERVRLSRALDRESRRIYRLKHNRFES